MKWIILIGLIALLSLTACQSGQRELDRFCQSEGWKAGSNVYSVVVQSPPNQVVHYGFTCYNQSGRLHRPNKEYYPCLVSSDYKFNCSGVDTLVD